MYVMPGKDADSTEGVLHSKSHVLQQASKLFGLATIETTVTPERDLKLKNA